MTALALREDQTQWDDQQLAVLHQTGIGDQVTPAELSAFLHLCQRTGLDPFARQIYLIGRWDSKAGREVFRPQTGIDGYRIVAQRTVERTKQSFGYEDTLWCGEDGKWTDVWLSPDPPAAAKVAVLRDGKRFPAIARWSEYVPTNRDGRPSGLWVKRHAAQLEKCAEALALRKAFPNDMAGVYTSEEMEQADNPPVVTAVAEVVRDEPAQQVPSDETWHVHPDPEPAAPEPVTDQEWLAATLRVIPQVGKQACGKLWEEGSAKFRAGELTEADSITVRDALKVRLEALAKPAAKAQPESAPPVAADLDPDDEWAAKVEEIPEGDDLAAAEVLEEASRMLGADELDADHYARIVAAVDAKFPQLSGEGKAAA